LKRELTIFTLCLEKAARYEIQQTQADPSAVNFINKKQGKKPARHQKYAPTKQGRPQEDKKPRVIFPRSVVLIVITMVILPVVAVSL
jgi:hypothetical protein